MSDLPLTIRRFRPADKDQLRAMVTDLLPAEPNYDFADEEVFVCDLGEGRLGGFASVSVRPWSDASPTMPIPHVEAWYVVPALRRKGIGSALMGAIESWCREAGFSELGSDAELENSLSIEAHRRLGFEPGLQLQYFRKRLPA